MYYYHSPTFWLSFMVALVIVGIIRWGIDSIKFQFGGKQAMKRDEERTMRQLGLQNKAPKSGKRKYIYAATPTDDQIEVFIENGDLDGAMTRAREMHQVAIEMDDEDSIKLYANYEMKINGLLAKRKVTTY
jgi:hypothetical protein